MVCVEKCRKWETTGHHKRFKGWTPFSHSDANCVSFLYSAVRIRKWQMYGVRKGHSRFMVFLRGWIFERKKRNFECRKRMEDWRWLRRQCQCFAVLQKLSSMHCRILLESIEKERHDHSLKYFWTLNPGSFLVSLAILLYNQAFVASIVPSRAVVSAPSILDYAFSSNRLIGRKAYYLLEIRLNLLHEP